MICYDSGLGLFGSVNYVNTMDVRQYLYCFVARPEASEDVRLLKGVTNIGKLDIVWKTNMGEKGRLQTSQLQRVVSFLHVITICRGDCLKLKLKELKFRLKKLKLKRFKVKRLDTDLCGVIVNLLCLI